MQHVVTQGASSKGTATGIQRRYYVYSHIVSFEETNVVGNVYFTRHLVWQGKCREMFLKDRAPRILGEIARDLRLVTLKVCCDYFQELFAFDEVELRMSLKSRDRNRFGLDFEYWRLKDNQNDLVARGTQQLACMRLKVSGLAGCEIPDDLDRALRAYAP